MYSAIKYGIMYLEIRYPERGRKLTEIDHVVKKFKTGFGNKIPREGTETSSLEIFFLSLSVFGNKIPREGTEIHKDSSTSSTSPFGNKIPREGTETVLLLSKLALIDLEIRYPERGRKLFNSFKLFYF